MQRKTSGKLHPTNIDFFATRRVDLFCSDDGVDAFNLIEGEYITVHDARPGVAPMVGQGSKPNLMDGIWASGASLYSRPISRSISRLFSCPFLPRVRLAGNPFAFPDASTTVRGDCQPYATQTRGTIAARFAV